ncbi:fungal-specific transcription factor domain-containing protein [Gigaspora rosea]|uniref:Fungal-specific transcription factor domain-containing protein n=1 Tax=Gigaspora rosea TaxID=44941 RepID=A0A397VKT9_9GLOM|nr:fungal-specific transcription factor domain-containing protein [Gigaspora rosea]
MEQSNSNINSNIKNNYQQNLHQFQSQQFLPLTTPTEISNNNNKEKEPLTKQDLQRLQKIVDLIFLNKSTTGTTVTSKLSTHTSEDDILSSIVLYLSLLVNKPLEINQFKFPINITLYHTYPNVLGEIIDNNNLNHNTITHPSIIKENISFNFNNNTFTPLCTPSKELCKQLINEYFNKFNVILPIINRKKFNDQLNKKNSEMIICAILAVAAARYSDDPSIQKTPDKPGGIFFDFAKNLLDTKYNIPSLETIQTLLLLGHAQYSMTRIHSVSMFFGMAVQMAHILHLERNDDTLSSDEKEERRRIFYCIYCVERWISFICEKPIIIDDINIDVPLPTLTSFDTLTKKFFIAWIKLSRILGQIWNFGYSSQALASHTSWFFHATDQKNMLKQIRLELTRWLRELPNELRCQNLSNADSSRAQPSDFNFSVFAGYINILFHTCILLLYQPYLTRTSGPTIEVQKQGPDGPVQMCLTSANTITEIVRTTLNYDHKSFCSFRIPFFGLLQSVALELVIMNGGAAQEFELIAKNSLNNSINELKFAAKNSNLFLLQDVINECERVIMMTNGKLKWFEKIFGNSNNQSLCNDDDFFDDECMMDDITD